MRREQGELGLPAVHKIKVRADNACRLCPQGQKVHATRLKALKRLSDYSHPVTVK